MLRFRGRPRDVSPKARMLNWMGYKLPFDRHDWIIDRCGQEVRYVIDFYEGKRERESDPPSIYIDARPEFSLGGVRDRLTMKYRELFGKKSQPSSASTATSS